MKKVVSITAISLLLTACDCNQIVSGMVVDADTQKPLDSVFVYNQHRPHDKVYTDTSGTFTVQSISGGLFGCPAMEVVVEKKGYQKQVVEISCGSDEKIALKKQE